MLYKIRNGRKRKLDSLKCLSWTKYIILKKSDSKLRIQATKTKFKLDNFKFSELQMIKRIMTYITSELENGAKIKNFSKKKNKTLLKN